MSSRRPFLQCQAPKALTFKLRECNDLINVDSLPRRWDEEKRKMRRNGRAAAPSCRVEVDYAQKAEQNKYKQDYFDQNLPENCNDL